MMFCVFRLWAYDNNLQREVCQHDEIAQVLSAADIVNPSLAEICNLSSKDSRRLADIAEQVDNLPRDFCTAVRAMVQ